MDIAAADKPPPASTPGSRHTSEDPRLSRVAQRPSIITSHPPVPRQAPAPAEIPSSSGVLEPVKQSVDNTPNTDVSDRSGESIYHHGSTVEHRHMVPILLRVSELAAVKGLKEKEKAALQDEDVSIKRRLEKAKSKGAFPVVIESIQADEAVSQSRIRKLQQDIDEIEKTRQQLAEALHGFLRQTPVPTIPIPASEGAPDKEKIAKLEAENQEMRAELRELKELIMQKTPEIPGVMQVQLSKLENSVNSQSMSNHGTNKRIRKLEEWKDGVENGAIKISSHSPETGPPQAPDLEPLRQDVEKAHGRAVEAQERAEAMGDRILILQRDIQSLRTAFDKDQLLRREQETRIQSAELSMRHVPGLKQRLDFIEKERLELKGAVSTAKEAKAKLQDLDTRYMTLSNGRIASLESTVRQLQTHEKSHSRVDTSQDQEAHSGFKSSIEKVESSQRSLWNNVNKLVLDTPQLLESSKQIQKCLSVTDSLVTAVRSLELRYSNISTEHLVKSMAAAMMEMYPSMSQALEQINSLRVHCSKEIATLKEAMKNADSASVDSKMCQLREEVVNKLQHLQTCISDQSKSLKDQLEETWELKNKFQTQSDAFSELGESIPQALQQAERVIELETKLEELSENLATLRANLQGWDVRETVTELSEQLETLSGKVDSLSVGQSAQEQAKKVTEISGKLLDLTANYQLLEDRLKSQELSDWQEVDELKADHGNLLEQLKSVEIRLESLDGSKKVTELSEELKTLSGDFKSLRTKFGEELGSVKARVDSLGHSEELSKFKSEMLARIEQIQAAIQSSAARNQTEHGHVQKRVSISHPAADGPITNTDPSGPKLEISERFKSCEGSSSQAFSEHTSSEDELGNTPAATADLPMGLRISENDNGYHENRSANKRARQGPLSDDKPSLQSATMQVPMAYQITENENGQTETGPPRKRLRRGTFSDDEREPRPAAPGRFTNGTGSSTGSQTASSKKVRKKQEKKVRKEQRKKQRQSFPH